MIGKTLLKIGKNPGKSRCTQVWFVPNYLVRSEGQCNPRKIYKFFISFRLRNSFKLFQTLQLTKTCYINKKIIFVKNWQFNYKLGPLQTIPNKKLPISQVFNELEKKLEVQLRILFKKYIFLLNWKKIQSPFRATFKNRKISFWIEKNLKLQPMTNLQMFQFGIYG